MSNDRAPTYGEKLVGLSFNPSGDEKVTRLKTLFAEIVDICAIELVDLTDDNQASPIWREAIMRSLDAQMWSVKAVTFKG